MLIKQAWLKAMQVRSLAEHLSLLHDIEPGGNLLGQIRQPKLSDKAFIALNLAFEASGIDSELNLFNQLPSIVADKIERSVYNKRRRRLSEITQILQARIADRIMPFEDYHLIDSMPLEVCKMSCSKRSTVCSEIPELSPDYGFCAAQQMHYYGFKIHAVFTTQGVFKAFDISHKATKVKQAYDLKNYDNIYAYGDTYEDKAMLALADHSYYRHFEFE